MYTVGLQSAADAFLVSSLKAQVALAFFVLFILIVFGLGSQKDGAVDSAAPVFLPGSHLLAIAPFFRQRFKFLNDGFSKTGQSLFQFNMLRVSIMVMQSQRVAHIRPSGDCHCRFRRVRQEIILR
jgi:hypothetical protein